MTPMLAGLILSGIGQGINAISGSIQNDKIRQNLTDQYQREQNYYNSEYNSDYTNSSANTATLKAQRDLIAEKMKHLRGVANTIGTSENTLQSFQNSALNGLSETMNDIAARSSDYKREIASKRLQSNANYTNAMNTQSNEQASNTARAAQAVSSIGGQIIGQKNSDKGNVLDWLFTKKS